MDDYLDSLGPIMPGDVKPVHVGWYVREWGVGEFTWIVSSRDYWDGATWLVGDAYGNIGDEDYNQERRWRGLSCPQLSCCWDDIGECDLSLEPFDYKVLAVSGILAVIIIAWAIIF